VVLEQGVNFSRDRNKR